jgi:WD40 repeat protein
MDDNYYKSVCKLTEEEIALLDNEGVIRLFNIKTLYHVNQFKVYDSHSIFCLNTGLFVLTKFKTLQLYNGTNKVNEVAFRCTRECLTILGAEHIATAAYREVHVHNAYTGKMIYALKGHEDKITSISCFETFLATISNEGVIKIWDIKARKCTRTINFYLSKVKSIYLINQNEIYVGGKELYRFDVRDLENWYSIKNTKAITWLNKFQVAYASTSKIEIYDFRYNKTVRILNIPHMIISDLYSLNDNLLLICCIHSKLYIWNIFTQEPMQEINMMSLMNYYCIDF